MTGDDGARRPVVEVLRARPTIGSILLVVGAVFSAVVVISVYGAAQRTLAWVFATIIVAWLLSSVIHLLDRWMPRGLAFLVTVVAFVALLAGVWVGVLTSLRSEVRSIETTLPGAAEEFEERYEAAADFRLAERVEAFLDHLDRRFGSGAQVSAAAGTVPTYVVTGVLMLFFLGYGPKYVSAALHQIRDPVRRATATLVVQRASHRAQAYLLITIAQTLVSVSLSWAVFTIVDLPAPFVLAVLVGVLGIVPYFGFVLGGLPALLVAAAEFDAFILSMVLGLVIGLQAVEAYVLRRRVDPRTVRVGPAPMVIVAIVGFQLYGVGGAVYGCAALVFLLAALDALPDHPADPSPSDQSAPTTEPAEVTEAGQSAAG